jgi:hypothetical protein
VLALVVGQALGEGTAVPGPDAGELVVIEAAPPGGAGRGRHGAGVDEQSVMDRARNCPSGAKRYRPTRLRRPCAAHQACSTGEMLISLVTVTDDGARVAGEDVVGVDGFPIPVPGVRTASDQPCSGQDCLRRTAGSDRCLRAGQVAVRAGRGGLGAAGRARLVPAPARRTGRDDTAWHRAVEAGGTTPTLPLLERLADALCLTLNVSLAPAER